MTSVSSAPSPRSLIEPLEPRCLLAGDASVVQALPYVLEFDRNRAGVLDKDGQATGFTWVQTNRFGNEYQPNLIDLRVGAGVLNITSTGNSLAGGNFGSDNTLTNGLQVQFSASNRAFTIVSRLRGPLTMLNAPVAQGGIMFGPDQENYVKLVAIQTPEGPALQFIDEQKTRKGYRRQLAGNSVFRLDSFETIQSLDLVLSGNPETRTVHAFFRINGGALQQLPSSLTLDADKGGAFFSPAARAGLIVMHKNDTGPVTVSFDRFEVVRGVPTISRPSVTNVRPDAGSTGVLRNSFVAADVFLPNPGQGIDQSTLTSASVKLYRTSDGQAVQANLNTSGGGDSIVLQPLGVLEPNTGYTFEVTEGLKDLSGASFLPFTSTFTTGTSAGEENGNIAFQRVSLPTAQNQSFAGATIGPDGRLYATTLLGQIFRYDILSDGTLSEPDVINTVREANGGPRFLTGLAFDPASTADNLIAWVSHGESAFENAQDWTGKISRLSGDNLQDYADAVVNLPRSIRDHLTNQLTFGPDGRLYIAQGSNTAMGAPDNAWGLRDEHELNAAILVADAVGLSRRIDLGEGPLDVKTSDGGTYDPLDTSNPLVLYATGIRNAYDLVWHSNGQLYVPANGSAAGGSTPATPDDLFSDRRIDFPERGAYTGPAVPGLTNVPDPEPDYLFRVDYRGYYGHPNPSRAEYVLNGGNPTSGMDANEVASYPVGVQPDRNYHPPAYVFGFNYAPAGIIEYHGNAFGGELNGDLLVVRYSGGDDVVSLDVAADGHITAEHAGIIGLTQFDDPVDLTEDTRNGNLYVVEYGGNRITLLRPQSVGTEAPNVKTSTSRLVYADPRGGSASESRRVVISNTGQSPLTISDIALGGDDENQFTITAGPDAPLVLGPGKSTSVFIAFKPSSGTSPGVKVASLDITSDDPDQPVKRVRLRGLATTGLEGANEPSLQRIMDLYELGINVGDTDPSDSNLPYPLQTPNDMLAGQRFVKAGSGPVIISPLAVFGVASDPAVQIGYYEPGTIETRKVLFNINSEDFQSVVASPNGANAFDPGPGGFGLFGIFPGFSEGDDSLRTVFSEDYLNTFEPDPDRLRHMLVFPLKAKDGSVVPNTFVIAFEEVPGGADFQDFVAILSNVNLAPAGPELGIQALDGGLYSDRLTFNKIKKLDPVHPNVYHDLAKVRIRNTGTSTLSISKLSITGPWKVTNPTGVPINIAPGAFRDVTVQFTASGPGSSDGVYLGSMRIFSNDADEPQRVVELAGFWQSESEHQQEPTLAQLAQVLGLTTIITYPTQQTNGGGKVEAIGDEVLSPYWQRADVDSPVTVQQLAAFHTQGNNAIVSWFKQGSNTVHEIFTQRGSDSQSLYPREDGVNAPAIGHFDPGGASQVFGFRIDSQAWSDDTKNPQEQPGGNYGHSVRFFPIRDRSGAYVPNTFLMVMDYFGVNYDYNDNVYLVHNIHPADKPAAPIGFAGFASADRVTLNWTDNEEDDLLGYYVYRSYKPTGGFKRFKIAPLTGSAFTDTTADTTRKIYYRVAAATTDGAVSVFSTATILPA